MAYHELKRKVEKIFTACIAREQKLDKLIEELEEYIDRGSEKMTAKKARLDNLNSQAVNKTFTVRKEIEAHQQQTYNPTPVSTKVNLKNVLKDTLNLQNSQKPTIFKKKLDISIVQDDSSTCSLLKLPVPKKRKFHITFDDINEQSTDGEEPSRRFPKWSFKQNYMKKVRMQAYVEDDLVTALFSCPQVDPSVIFPTHDFIRNSSSIWEDSMDRHEDLVF